MISSIKCGCCEHAALDWLLNSDQLQPSKCTCKQQLAIKHTKVSLITFFELRYTAHGSLLISTSTACDQVGFLRISLTGFRSCSSCSQTGTSQRRQHGVSEPANWDSLIDEKWFEKQSRIAWRKSFAIRRRFYEKDQFSIKILFVLEKEYTFDVLAKRRDSHIELFF